MTDNFKPVARYDVVLSGNSGPDVMITLVKGENGIAQFWSEQEAQRAADAMNADADREARIAELEEMYALALKTMVPKTRHEALRAAIEAKAREWEQHLEECCGNLDTCDVCFTINGCANDVRSLEGK